MKATTRETNTETVIFHVSPSFKAQIKRAAEAEMMPMTTFIRRALAKAIEERAEA